MASASRDRSDGSDPRLVQMVRPGGREDRLGSGREHPVEDDLLAVWNQPAHRESALAVCSERDHMAAQWTARIGEALTQIRHRTSPSFVTLIGACETLFDETFRVETANGSLV